MTRASQLLLSLCALVASQGCATTSSNLAQKGVVGASHGVVVTIDSMTLTAGPTRRLGTRLVIRNEGERPLEIAAKDILLLDADGRRA